MFLNNIKKWFSSCKQHVNPRPQSKINLRLEGLENRDLMAAGVTAGLGTDGVLRITGTDANDKIYVLQSDGPSQAIWVGRTMQGQELGSFPTKGAAKVVKSIEVVGNGGSDLIDLLGTHVAHHVKLATTVYADTKILTTTTGGNDTVIGGDARDTIYGGGGNDNLDGQFDIDKLYGGFGNDTLNGSSGSDYLYGEDGEDKLFGGNGNDTLDGGKGNNWLEAGSATESAVNGWNAHKPVVDGMKYSDIDQQQMGSCAFLASLAATVKTGRMSESFITYLGNFTYSVKFFDPTTHRAFTANATFDGTMASYFDPVKRVTNNLDPATANYEFWTVIYQRAYFKQFHSIDYVARPVDGNNFGGEHIDKAMARLMPYSFAQFSTTSKEFTPEYIAARISENWGVTASLSALGTGIDAATGKPEVSNHAYMISKVYTVVGISGKVSTFVQLYNPWGSSRLHGTRLDGRAVTIDPSPTVNGLFTMNWDDFKAMANYFAW